MSSPSGRAYIRDALLGDPDGSNAGQCPAYAAEQVDVILARAIGRKENTPDVETATDRVAAYARRLVTELLDAGEVAGQ